MWETGITNFRLQKDQTEMRLSNLPTGLSPDLTDQGPKVILHMSSSERSQSIAWLLATLLGRYATKCVQRKCIRVSDFPRDFLTSPSITHSNVHYTLETRFQLHTDLRSITSTKPNQPQRCNSPPFFPWPSSPLASQPRKPAPTDSAFALVVPFPASTRRGDAPTSAETLQPTALELLPSSTLPALAPKARPTTSTPAPLASTSRAPWAVKAANWWTEKIRGQRS